jgi:hypothetical protein
MADPGDCSETVWTPGDTTSGFAKPLLLVGPRLEKTGTVSSVIVIDPWSFDAPTVITNGSSPGFMMVRAPGPELPAETTTAMPDCHARSTA